jgi:hypothetical protein
MRNEPNFQKSQMFISSIKTRNYNEKFTLDTWSKRTQSNPILPAMAGKIAPLFRMSFILMGPTYKELARPELACGELVEPVEVSNLFAKAGGFFFKKIF